MNAEQRRHLEDLLQTYQRRLRALEKQKATFGLRTPPEIQIEIEDAQAEIARIEADLSVDSSSPKPSKPADGHETVGNTAQARIKSETQTPSARGNAAHSSSAPTSRLNKQKRVTSTSSPFTSPGWWMVAVVITIFMLILAWSGFNRAKFATTPSNSIETAVANFTVPSADVSAVTVVPGAEHVPLTSDVAATNLPQSALSPTKEPISDSPLAATTSLTGKIAFVSNRTGSWEIYEMSVDGNTQAKISNRQSADASSPSWSRDATQIAFTSKDEAGNNQIYVMNADGSGMFRLTNVSGDAGVPTWMPNGKQIAFQVRDKNGGLAIFVVNLNDKQQFALTHNPAEDKYPASSPVAQRIAFESYRDGNWELYVTNADGSSQAQRLTSTSADEHGPAWSPDGQKIAYIVEQNGQRDIYTMNADGSNPTNITHASLTNPGVPSWSPDGQYIAFQAGSDNEWQLFVMKADGSDRRQLTFRERDGVNYFPAWSPSPR